MRRVQHKDDGQKITVRPNGTTRVVTVNKTKSETVQSDVNQSEIKKILARYEATGIIDHLANVDLQFRDVTEFDNLADALQQLKEAEHVFNELPPQIRNTFENDPAQWLDAAHDGLNEAQTAALTKLGVIQAPEPEAPVEPPPPPPAE